MRGFTGPISRPYRIRGKCLGADYLKGPSLAQVLVEETAQASRRVPIGSNSRSLHDSSVSPFCNCEVIDLSHRSRTLAGGSTHD